MGERSEVGRKNGGMEEREEGGGEKEERGRDGRREE